MGVPLLDLLGLIGGQFFAGPEEEQARQLEEQNLAAVVGGKGPKGAAGIRLPDLQPLHSAYDGVKADPEALASQRDALAHLERLANDGGGIELRAGLNQAEQAANQNARSQLGAVEQQMAARGMAGSGLDFALKAQAGQDAANRSASMGTEGALAQRRAALDALQGQTALSSTMRNQAAQMDLTRAGGQDAISRFNSGLTQQQFGNQMALTGMANDARGQAANRHYANADRIRGVASGIADMGSGAVESGVGMLTGVATGNPMAVAGAVAPKPRQASPTQPQSGVQQGMPNASDWEQYLRQNGGH